MSQNHTNQCNIPPGANIAMKIDAENPAPKYVQLRGILREFLGKHYQTGQKIPTEIELVDQFKVSRNTVRQAITELEQEGLLSKEQGRGTFFLGTSLPEEGQGHDALIGTITPRSSYIYAHVFQGINETATRRHYNVVLGTSEDNPEQEFMSLEQLLKKNIDGLLLEPNGGFVQWQESKSLCLLKTLKIPAVIMGWYLDDLDLSYVALDDVEAGFRATQFLLNAGHTRIAYVYPGERLPGIRRYQGYRKALEASGVAYDPRLDKALNLSQRTHNKDYIHEQIQECLALGTERPTAFFFFNDEWALRSYRSFRELGVKVPDDVSIIGCDNFEYSELAEVPLTTIIHPQEKIGSWAAEILLDEIKHPGQRTPRQITVKPAIAIRDSVRSI